MKYNYLADLETEVLREIAAGIKASFNKYFIKYNISLDNKDEPLVILFLQLNELSNSLIKEDKSLEELKDIQAQLKFMREFASNLK